MASGPRCSFATFRFDAERRWRSFAKPLNRRRSMLETDHLQSPAGRRGRGPGRFVRFGDS